MKKIKFNLVDCIIVCILLLAVGLAGYKAWHKPAASTSVDSIGQVTLQYKVEFTGKMEYLTDKFKVGEKVFVGDKDKTEGTIVDAVVRDSEKMTLDSLAGTYIWAAVPNRYDIIITIESQATHTGDAIKAGGVTPIHVGEEYVVRGKGYAGLGFVIESEIVD